MKSALIGYTGFVGSNLSLKQSFQGLYNSRNIEQIKGQEFNMIVCAGAPAVKWLANKEPQKDKESLKKLMDGLGNVKADTVVLISTIDVYPDPSDVTEESAIDKSCLSAYGKHRLELEEFIHEKFSHSVIIRLPGLFGNGLKKNIIYDYLNNNCLDMVHQDAVFQFYNIDNLWRDIKVCIEKNINLINFATQPVSAKEVVSFAFNKRIDNNLTTPAPKYDFQTIHAGQFGKTGPYLYSKQEILEDIKSFVDAYKK